MFNEICYIFQDGVEKEEELEGRGVILEGTFSFIHYAQK